MIDVICQLGFPVLMLYVILEGIANYHRKDHL